MSLINKVLKDLDARKNAPAKKPPHQPMLDDLRPTMGSPSRRRSRMLIVVLLLAAIGGGIYFSQQGELDNAFAKVNTWLASVIGGAPPVKPAEVAQLPVPAAAPETLTPVTPSIEAAPVTEGGAAPPADTSPVPLAKDDAPVTAKPETTAKAPTESPQTGTSTATSMNDKSASPVAKPEVHDKPATVAKVATPPAKKPAAVSKGDGRIEKKDHPQTIEELAEDAYRQGVRAMQQGRPAQADQALRQALAHDPRHLAARELLAGLQLEQGRPADARATLEQGVTLSPEHVPFAQLLARLYVDQGADRNALAVLEKVRAEGAKQPEYLAFLATLYQRAGRYPESAESYRQALGQRPQEGRWWLGLGISLEAEKNATAAREAYQRAMASVLDPKLARYAEQRLGALKN